MTSSIKNEFGFCKKKACKGDQHQQGCSVVASAGWRVMTPYSSRLWSTVCVWVRASSIEDIAKSVHATKRGFGVLVGVCGAGERIILIIKFLYISFDCLVRVHEENYWTQ